MKVWVSVHGRYHAFDLAGQLARHGMLRGVTTTYPKLAARRWLSRETLIENAPALEFARRLHGRIPLVRPPDVFIARRIANLTAHRLPKDTDLLVSWSGATLETISVAAARGIPIVLERGSSHIEHQTEVVEEAYVRADIPFVPTDPRVIERELAEYQRVDRIAVPTRFAAKTFTDRGISADKLIVNPYGADLDDFHPATPVPRRRVRILFVGRVGPRKGVPVLLAAFARLGVDAELVLAGPIEPGMDRCFRACAGDAVQIRGAVPGASIADEMRNADIFCLPSVEEGMALAMLQAMASGLPVVATAETGAEDIIDNDVQGCIVPLHDSDRLAEVLAHLIHRPALRRQMGVAAREKIATGFTWDDYGDRAVAAYRKLIAAPVGNRSGR